MKKTLSFDPVKLILSVLAIVFACKHDYTAAVILAVAAATCGVKVTLGRWR